MGWLIFDTATGAELRRQPNATPLAPGEGVAAVPVQPMIWSAPLRGWLDPPEPRRLTGLQILGLYTSAQHARMRRMLFATHQPTYPDGHPQAGQPNPLAGQLVDPEGLVQRLADATLAMPGTILVTDPLHVNGTGLYRALGIIESDEEAARIAAGITPEEWAQGVRP